MINQNSLYNLRRANTDKKSCSYCLNSFTLANINKHEKSCKCNPKNIILKECPVCKNPHSKSGVTCSYSCSNTYFRSSINNPNWKIDTYRTTCWHYHTKKCVVCNEEKIVEVHHYNHNHSDNRPENLVPLCPTHHQYLHSRYADEIKNIVDSYVKNYVDCNIKI